LHFEPLASPLALINRITQGNISLKLWPLNFCLSPGKGLKQRKGQKPIRAIQQKPLTEAGGKELTRSHIDHHLA